MNHGIIFDLDGTLWDSSEQVAVSWSRALASRPEADRQVTGEDMRSYMGKTLETIAELMLPEIEPALRMEIMRDCERVEQDYLIEHGGTLFPNLEKELERLSKSFSLFIVSNCQSGYIDVFLRSTGLTPCIRGHLCHGDTGRSKGETLRMLMKREGLSSPVYVGDTQGDAHACAQAGIPMVWASYGFGKVKGPWRMISAFDQLTELLHEL